MIVIAGHIRTSSNLVNDLAAALNSLVEATLREDGCLNYHFAVDDASAGTVLVYERWRDQAALSAHLAQPAVVAVLAGWTGRIDLEVRKFDATKERGALD